MNQTAMNKSTKGGNNSRVLQLDILRAFAILTVLLHHIPNNCIGNGLISDILWAFKKGGWCGVDMFFVISGFLVSGIYFREYTKTGTISVKNFLIRRGFKIYPGFYFLIIATLIIYPPTTKPVTTNSILSEIFFYQSYVEGIWGATWSLAVEEHFYIFLSVIFFIFYKLNSAKAKSGDLFKFLPTLFLIVAILCVFFRIINIVRYPEFSFLKHYSNSHIRLDSLLFGVLLSYYYYFKPEKIAFIGKHKFLVMALCLSSLLLYFIFQREEYNSIVSVLGLSHLYLIFGLMLIAFLNIDIKRNILTTGLKYIGKNSYAIYLWHFFVLNMLLTITQDTYITYVYLILSIVAGGLVTFLIEDPFLRLRDKLFPSKSGSLQVNSKVEIQENKSVISMDRAN